jgi:hypothetical protein
LQPNHKHQSLTYNAYIIDIILLAELKLTLYVESQQNKNAGFSARDIVWTIFSHTAEHADVLSLDACISRRVDEAMNLDPANYN